MKIHIIQPAVPDYRTKFFENIAQKYECTIYACKEDFLGVKSVSINVDSVFSDRFLVLLRKFYWHRSLPLIKEFNKGDVVVVNGNPRIINYMLLLLILKIKGIKSVWWGHGWSANSHGLASKIRIYLMRLATNVLVYTDYEAEHLPYSNVYSLNNGLDSDKIQKSMQYVKETDMNTFVDDEFSFVFVGRLTKKSNISLLIEAISMIERKVKLHIIGSCPEIEDYKFIARKFGVEAQLVWHGALFDENDIARVMLQSSVFVYPGSVGLSLIHAFNYGLPVLVHDSRKLHMPEFASFKENYNGLTFNEGNLKSLSEKLVEFIEMDVRKRTLLGENALQTVENSYNNRDMTNRFFTMIKGMK